MAVEIRRAVDHDLPFLEEMLQQALFVPHGMGPIPEPLLASPAISRYVTGFGSRAGDVGFVATNERRSLGAVWARLWTSDDAGYGFVDEHTPEAVAAVRPQHRGRGIGTALFEALVEVVPRLSLSVDDRSEAVGLYERLGFETIAHVEHSLVMLRSG